MKLFLVGLSHKTAPIEIREKLQFSNEHSHQYLEKLAQTSEVESGIVLSTCNRVEIYASSPEPDIHHQLKGCIYDFHGLGEAKLDPYFYTKTGEDAVRHLFTVASSLDSIVVGEPQILGQVKDAYDISKKLGMIDSFFEQVLQKTFFVAKKVRNETDIGKFAVSISSMAVELSGKIFDSLKGKNALILGSGEMAELAVANLKQKGIDKMWIANRTFETAAKLAKTFDAFPIYLEQFQEVMHHADIVIAATGMQNYLITREMAETSLDKRNQQPQLFVDISVPRNIQPEVGEVNNAYLYNIDDLQTMVHENQQVRMEASKKASSMIDLELSTFLKDLQQKKYSPAIQKLQQRIDTLVENEWKRSFANREMTPELVQKFKESIVQKMMASPIHFLKNED
ncbi:MAG: glutamyl-tRNA reductase, partial [Proteobacteria bacterium]|nr:glutamyl-tRNA reductase [Pseudomonadota bacterium]